MSKTYLAVRRIVVGCDHSERLRRGPLGIASGDRLALTVTEDGEIRMVKKAASFRDTIGLLAHLAKNRTVDVSEETNFALDSAMSEQEARSKKAHSRTK